MWGLTINMSKTDYLKVGEDTVSDLQMDTNIVKDVVASITLL